MEETSLATESLSPAPRHPIDGDSNVRRKTEARLSKDARLKCQITSYNGKSQCLPTPMVCVYAVSP